MNAPRIAIRPARSADAAALAALAGQLGYPSTEADILRRLVMIEDRPQHAVFVAEADGAVAGWVHVLLDLHLESGEFAEIAGLVVDEHRRGAGVGQRLLVSAEAWARDQGAGTVRVRSNVVRTEAHGFYAKAGYAVRKRQTVFEKRF